MNVIKELLKKCAALAHIAEQDACNLEQDIKDMIEMVNGLPDSTWLENNRGVLLQELRDDEDNAFTESKKLFENSAHMSNGSICVPKINGV